MLDTRIVFASLTSRECVDSGIRGVPQQMSNDRASGDTYCEGTLSGLGRSDMDDSYRSLQSQWR